MSEKKPARIAKFIESLPIDASVENCESVLLSTNMGFVGGDNGGNCINELWDQCHKAENKGDCQNYNSACPNSKNRGSCLNTNFKRDYGTPEGGVINPACH